jgi:hypothetical protein
VFEFLKGIVLQALEDLLALVDLANPISQGQHFFELLEYALGGPEVWKKGEEAKRQAWADGTYWDAFKNAFLAWDLWESNPPEAAGRVTFTAATFMLSFTKLAKFGKAGEAVASAKNTTPKTPKPNLPPVNKGGRSTTPGSKGGSWRKPNAPSARMARPPAVKNADLQNRINQAYIRPGYNSQIPGDGSLVSAIRYELQTGIKVGNADHLAKGRIVRNSLRRWLRLNKNADPSDIQIAQRVLKEIEDALAGR